MPLAGTFEIDAEGVVPKDELILVDKGMLRTLLNDRVPTLKVKESNGYSRFALRGSGANSQIAPGVINISYSNGESLKSLRKAALKVAEKDGLEYIYVIRKLETNSGQGSGAYRIPDRSTTLSKPIGIYKVSVKTGEEELSRSAVISDFPMIAFKQVILGSKEQFVYNTLFNSAVPVSFIVPKAIVFNDISIEKDKGTKTKLPMVPNPLANNN